MIIRRKSIIQEAESTFVHAENVLSVYKAGDEKSLEIGLTGLDLHLDIIRGTDTTKLIPSWPKITLEKRLNNQQSINNVLVEK